MSFHVDCYRCTVSIHNKLCEILFYLFTIKIQFTFEVQIFCVINEILSSALINSYLLGLQWHEHRCHMTSRMSSVYI